MSEPTNTVVAADSILNVPSKLVNGCIPAHTICPFKDSCGLAMSCHHMGLEHTVEFSCASARAGDLIERTKKLKEALTQGNQKS
jgi:hypothetical protein